MKIMYLKPILYSMLLLFSTEILADSEQKMILVKEEKSFLMEGDTYKNSVNKPKGYSKDSVLPALLSAGWQIKSVHVNENSTENSLYGYVVIERKQ